MPTHGKVILDPTGIYAVPDDVDVITTERQWLESIGRSSRACWVKGEWLSRWTREWLRQQGAMELIVEEKVFPRARLQFFLKNVPVPQNWNDTVALQWVQRLESYDPKDAVAYLLSDLVPTAPNLWFEPPSIEHLARFLALEAQEELRPFIHLWTDELSERCDEPWVSFYRSEDRNSVLRTWIGLEDGHERPSEIFPLDIPESLARQFDAVWTTRIVETSGEVIDALDASKQCGMNRIARVAEKVLSSRQSWISATRIRKLRPYLPSQVAQKIMSLLPPTVPPQIMTGTSTTEALSWATNYYLPFRRWQAQHEPTGIARDSAESLADSFVMWLLAAYPTLKLDPVIESALNYSVAAKVLAMSREGPVLWVVIDGLGWLEHVDLVELLCSSHAFKVRENIEPRISILPTKTEFAKWSLYAQLLPSHPSWEPDASKGFRNIPDSERYTDAPNRREALVSDLRDDHHRIYCWDTTEYDSLFHNDTSWKHVIDVAVPNKLIGLANEISYFVSRYRTPSTLQVVLSSDHGQLMGEHNRLENLPSEFEFGGRMAIGRVPDDRFVILEADRYGLQNDISVVRGSGCIQTFQVSQAGTMVGVHGGLFPEEVIVGVSVLQFGVERHPVSVLCRGKGRANEGGTIDIEISNPNDTQLTDAFLYLREVAELAGGCPLQITVGPYGRELVSLQVNKWPQLPVGSKESKIPVTGFLQFRFAEVENGSAEIAKESLIEVTQMFRSGLDIDEFI